MTEQKQPENVEYLKYFGRMMTDNKGYLQKIKSRVAMLIATFKKKTLFASKLNLNLGRN